MSSSEVGILSFKCNCSHERVLTSLHTVYAQHGDSLFDPGKETLEVKCEYCKTAYEVSRAELKAAGNSVN